jgi:hypothetical protein
VFQQSVQNWEVNANGTLFLEETIGIDAFGNQSVERTCWPAIMKHKPCKAPHSDYIHFTGKTKPWLLSPPDRFEIDAVTSPQHFWFHTLNLLNNKLQMSIQFEDWRKYHRPFLGLFPTQNAAANTFYALPKE